MLQVDPKNINSIKGIAYLYLQMKKFDLAKEYYKKASEVDPNDPEPYYSMAVIDWTQTYQPRMEERAKLGLKPEDSLPAKDKKVCAMVKEKNSANIQEGIDNLNKALQLRPDYDDAMAYMNLMYRERADVQCDDQDARAADLKTADEWVDKTMATKKAKAEKQPGHGRHRDGPEQVDSFPSQTERPLACRRRGLLFMGQRPERHGRQVCPGLARQFPWQD